jgi:uncharacterized protein
LEKLEFYQIEVGERVLVYAPLKRYAGLFERAEVRGLLQALNGVEEGVKLHLRQLAQALLSRADEQVHWRSGPIASPLFLGLITTRGCNLRCRYCGFLTPLGADLSLSPELAKASIDAYLAILSQVNISVGEVQFFGGEPFFDNEIVEYSLPYARVAAERKGIVLRFEVTTNGFTSRRRIRWVAENFDTVVLSLDGPEQFHDANRPTSNGKGSFRKVFETAKILSHGNCDLVIRVCVTGRSVEHLVEIAGWVAGQFVVSEVCFEPLTVSDRSTVNGLEAPDPYRFAYNFCQAADFLERLGVAAVTSGVDIDRLGSSFCPVGQDAILVAPGGVMDACYLPEENRLREGLELSFGRVTLQPPGFEIDQERLDRIRALCERQAPLCADCFCKYHCAGGCHVNHRNILQAADYDAICLQTRLITTGNILKRIGRKDRYQEWLASLPDQQRLLQ